MSKVGQAVFEAEEFAAENYNVARDDFVKLSNKAFSNKPFQLSVTLEAFDEIQQDLTDYDRYVNKE